MKNTDSPPEKARWCNGLYKLDAKKQLESFMKLQGAYVVSYIGYCADETRRMNKRSGKAEIYPLADFGIEEQTILEWARNVPEFNNYYKTNRRCGCMYCPLSNMMNFAYTAKYYPEQFADMISKMRACEIARERETGKPFSVISGKNPERYNAEYLAEIIPRKWIPRLEKTGNYDGVCVWDRHTHTERGVNRMTSAEIYCMICEMMLNFLKTEFRFGRGETALDMYVYSACGYYPQDSEWYKNHGIADNVIQCVP